MIKRTLFTLAAVGLALGVLIVKEIGTHSPDKTDASPIDSINTSPTPEKSVQVTPVVPSAVDQNQIQDLTDATAGKVLNVDKSTSKSIDKAVGGTGARPVLIFELVEYRAMPGVEITFDASRSYSPQDRIVKWEWDLDGDNVFEVLDGGKVAKHTYANDGEWTAQLRVTDSNGLVAMKAVPVIIGLMDEVPPQPPRNLQAKFVSADTAKITWDFHDQPSDKIALFINGVGIGHVTGDRRAIEINDLDETVETTVSVAGMTADGKVGPRETSRIRQR